MTAIAVEVTVTPDEAARIEQARGVLSRARVDSFDWPHTDRSCRRVRMAAGDLEEILKVYEDLLAGTLHPASVYEDLAVGHPDDALAQALALATGEIEDCASALVIIVRRECSEEMAAMVSGQDGLVST
jgi:hypothetical protein